MGAEADAGDLPGLQAHKDHAGNQHLIVNFTAVLEGRLLSWPGPGSMWPSEYAMSVDRSGTQGFRVTLAKWLNTDALV
jgi:hypothetical protein